MTYHGTALVKGSFSMTFNQCDFHPRIESVTKVTKSLMYEPSQLGLTAQAIADIVAFLKGLNDAHP